MWVGIHDLSSVAPDSITGLPRFNMPLELGLFLGCKRFGTGGQERKRCLILDSDPYRYRTFISDISGLDIHAHGSDPERAIREVRDWLRANSKQTGLPGAAEIVRHFRTFQNELADVCSALGLESDRFTFLDLSQIIRDWFRTSR